MVDTIRRLIAQYSKAIATFVAATIMGWIVIQNLNLPAATEGIIIALVSAACTALAPKNKPVPAKPAG